ncbi:uncharacterized protein LOC124401146 [Silurus meridionalis]|uniref:uncharacterized protein LOC124401146 n=1 Tax=Silurus meridionalis TaxID=175797 RepID=UPI001EEBC646|nr:uncharacterized protein LOC124401146 [Silurus meridionalis]
MVTDAEKIVLSHPLILHTSHQAAELYALTRACVLSADPDVTIYTDSCYAFGVAHDFGRIWQSRGFTAADGKPISHASLVQDLITACHLPRSLAIVKTRAHCSGDTDEVRGNSLADRMAKQAAASRPLPPDLSPAMVSVNTMISAVLPDMDLPSYRPQLLTLIAPSGQIRVVPVPQFWSMVGVVFAFHVIVRLFSSANFMVPLIADEEGIT